MDGLQIVICAACIAVLLMDFIHSRIGFDNRDEGVFDAALEGAEL
jgi:hypothetical protein